MFLWKWIRFRSVEAISVNATFKILIIICHWNQWQENFRISDALGKLIEATTVLQRIVDLSEQKKVPHLKGFHLQSS